MSPSLRSFVTPALLLLVTTAAAAPVDGVLLDRATIVTDSAEPSFVRHGVLDLAEYLTELTGNEVPVVNSFEKAEGTRILVGTRAIQQVFPNALPNGASGAEAYLLRCVRNEGVQYVLVGGAGPRGTKIALGLLMKEIRAEGKSAFVASTLDLAGEPAFAKRGMHFNGWAINYPHSFRCWREEDWHRYLDILSYQGVNLLYFWPFIEIMPVPLSPEDEAYLQECRRIVDFAQKKHGMEVWIMQCTNRVAKDHCGVADPRHRPYWRPSQEDLDPGNAEHFRAIMESREAMYRIINNADGVCNIDSDPGFFPGSPLSDYVKVLQGCRTLLDRHNLRGDKALLINWMLWGWGRAERIQIHQLDEHQRRTVQLLKRELPEPWWLICSQFGFLPPGQYQFLPVCRDEGVLEKTVFLPYGIIEFEPSYPGTTIRIDDIRGTFNNQIAKFPGLSGVMGNVQTPLNQFPNLYFLTSAILDLDYRERSAKDVLGEMSAHLYPDHRQLLTDCFLALEDSEPARIEELAGQLDLLVREDRLGRPGVFGRKLFPDHRVVAESLILQLRLLAAHRGLLLGITPTTPTTERARLLGDYLDAFLTWDTAHGWHKLFGWNEWPLPILTDSALIGGLRENLGGEPEVGAFFAQIAETLSARHDPAVVLKGCIEPLKSAVLAARPE